MPTADSYTRFVAERTTPLTSGETLHWDGRSIASRGGELMPALVPGVCAVVPAQGPLVSGDYPPDTMRQRGRIGVPPTPEIVWATEAASMTVNTFLVHRLFRRNNSRRGDAAAREEQEEGSTK